MDDPTSQSRSHDPPSRRTFLRATGGGVAAVAGLAGCLARGERPPRYVLSARRVGQSLADALRWTPRGRFPDADREAMDRLVERGSLTTEGFALFPAPEGRPRYVERDGTYYEVTVDRTGEVRRDRWVFWFDLVDGDPTGDAEVFTSSLGLGTPTDLEAEYGLSERDVGVVEDAAGEIPTEFGFRDPADDPPGRRGHVFVRRSPDETALLPDPPFTHVAFETNEGTRYARAVAERTTVALSTYDHAARPVAESPADFVAHVRDRHLAVAFDRTALPDDQRSILDEVTAGLRHEDREAPSGAMATLLDRLGIDAPAVPDSGMVEFSEEVYFAYAGEYYEAQLEVFG